LARRQGTSHITIATSAKSTAVANGSPRHRPFRETITAAHHSPEFRKKWPQFGKIAEEIDPCLYDLVHVEAA
jgi:hypothetical protein